MAVTCERRVLEKMGFTSVEMVDSTERPLLLQTFAICMTSPFMAHEDFENGVLVSELKFC